MTLAVDPTGGFLAVAASGANAISMHSMDPSTGSLAPVSGSPFAAGTVPHAVAFESSGRFLYAANANTNSVSAFSMASSTGVLTAVPGAPFPAGTGPTAMTTVATSP